MAFWKKNPRTEPRQITSEQSARPERRSFMRNVFALAAGGAVAAGSGVIGRVRPAGASTTGANPFIGEISLVAFNFPPVGWAFCDGQILSIAQNTALFSLLGTNFGGDGVTTFALPDLRSRVPIHAGGGAGPGLSPYVIGQSGGVENVTLLATQMPAHSHVLNGSSANGTSDSPAGAVPARNASGVPDYGASPNTTMNAGAIGTAGGNQPHSNVQPYLALNYIIALEGIYPSRSTPAGPTQVTK